MNGSHPGQTAASARSAAQGFFNSIPGIGTITSALGGLWSQRQTRKRNRRQERLMRESWAREERLSNTAYQRAAKDLEAAGLNRILALGKPASTPTGGVPQLLDEGVQAVNTAVSLRRQNQELKNLRAQEKLTLNQASREIAQANLIQSQDAQTQQLTNESLERMRNIIEQRTGITFKNKLADFEQQISSLRIPGVRSEEQFYTWLLSTETEEIFKATSKAGPLVLAALRAWVSINRKGR